MSESSSSRTPAAGDPTADEESVASGLRCWLALFAAWLRTWAARTSAVDGAESHLRTWPSSVEAYFGRLSFRYYAHWINILPCSADANSVLRPEAADSRGRWPVWREVSAYLLCPADHADVRRMGGLLREVTIYSGAEQPPDHALGLLMGGLKLRIRDLVRSHLREAHDGHSVPLDPIAHALPARLPSGTSDLAPDEMELLVKAGSKAWDDCFSLRGRVALVLALFRLNARAPRILAAARSCQALVAEGGGRLSQNVFYNRLRGTNEDGKHRKGELDRYLEKVMRVPGLNDLPPSQQTGLPSAALDLATELSLRWLKQESALRPLLDAIRQSLTGSPLAARLDAE